MSSGTETISTRIWLEEPEPGDPFVTRAAYCHGYDVYGQMLGRARWADMLFLLFKGEAPSRAQAQLLETLAVALANPGPRDPSVHAAMCAGTGGSTAAASLMAALAVGAGRFRGGRDVFDAMSQWQECGLDVSAWQRALSTPHASVADTWPATERAPGFDPHEAQASTPVQQVLACLAQVNGTRCLGWLQHRRAELEAIAGMGLAMTGVAAAAFIDLGFKPEEGEMLHLLLRLPGAAAHALEQRGKGFRAFPLFSLDLQDDPGSKTA